MMSAIISKLCYLFTLASLVACREKETLHKSSTKSDLVEVKQILASDLNGDKIIDTIILNASSKNPDLGYNLALSLHVSRNKDFKVKKVVLGDSESAVQWCLSVENNWITVGHADKKIGEFYEIFIDNENFRFELRKQYKIDFFSKIREKRKVFEFGELPVEMNSITICSLELGIVVGDSIANNFDHRDECIQIPKYCDDSERTEGAAMLLLGLPQLKNISQSPR